VHHHHRWSKRAEALLLQQSTAIEEFHRRYVRSADGEYVYLSETHVKLYGYDEARKLLGKKGWEVLATKEQISEWFRTSHLASTTALARRRSAENETEALSRKGSPSALEGGGFCLRRSRHHRNRRAAEGAPGGEGRFRHLIEQAADASSSSTPQGRFVDANRRRATVH